MTRWQVAFLWRCLTAAALSQGLACGASAPASRQAPTEFVPAEIQPGLGESIVSKSSLDTSNRYLATVLVEGGEGTCTGVLVAPRVVVTAGHCVCSRREAPSGERGGTLIDKTTCARTATVKVLSYRSEGEPDKEDFTGTVTPHEQLAILYDKEGKEVSSHADLAAIFLRAPPKGVRPIRLSTQQLRYTQPVTLVGYGTAQLGVPGGGKRRFGLNEVASIAESGATFLVGKPIQVRRPYKPKEVVLIRADASYSLAGDSGGPCLREHDGTMELVGIAKTHYGSQELVQFSEYTSTYFYLEWLRRQIATAERTGTD